MNKKDVLIFVSERENGVLSHKDMPTTSEPASILPDGRIDIGCECLQSSLAHQCGHLFRLAIGCFNSSTKNPRGVDCGEFFKNHALCLAEAETS